MVAAVVAAIMESFMRHYTSDMPDILHLPAISAKNIKWKISCNAVDNRAAKKLND
jgi:hypothetical protein